MSTDAEQLADLQRRYGDGPTALTLDLLARINERESATWRVTRKPRGRRLGALTARGESARLTTRTQGRGRGWTVTHERALRRWVQQYAGIVTLDEARAHARPQT